MIGQTAASFLSAVACLFLTWMLPIEDADPKTRAGQFSAALTDDPPDALALLRGVETARLNISSGRLELEVTSTRVDPPKHGTDHIRLSIVFNGANRRFDQYQKILVIDGSGPDGGEARNKKLKDLQGDRDAFVRLGLGEWTEDHRRSAFDGTRMLTYSENDGGAYIRDPKGGSGDYLFDPRTLGLTGYSVINSVKSALAYGTAKSVSLVGSDEVSGRPTWHVRVVDKYDRERHLWIEDAPGFRVFKHEFRSESRSDVTTSEYTDDADDPLPSRVEVRSFRDGKMSHQISFTRKRAEFNIAVEPRAWTLAGLDMPIGVAVVDERIHRRIGYWDGEGLSEDSPKGAAATKPTQPPRHAGSLLELAEKDPGSPLALDAVVWIVMNSPDGPEVNRAMDILLREHIENEKLDGLCRRMASSRTKAAEPLFRAVLEKNPHRAVQAPACFGLAMVLKDQTERGVGAKPSDVERLARETEQLLERVIAEFADVKQPGGSLADAATSELFELRNLGVGKTAPDIEGEDTDGQRFKLSDYRGKVVVLSFWGDW